MIIRLGRPILQDLTDFLAVGPIRGADHVVCPTLLFGSSAYKEVMRPGSPDYVDYRFLTASGAALKARFAADDQGQPELQLFGNRAGILSLANVLLWLVANAYRREFLALAELPFVQIELPLSVCLRLTDADAAGQDGLLCRTDRGEQLEWSVSEDDLQRVALHMHRLASNPCHEYDRLLMSEGSVAGIHVRMTDAAEWLNRNHAQQGPGQG